MEKDLPVRAAHGVAMTAEALLLAIARAVAPLVARELAASTVLYTATEPPPGRSKRWMREHARHVPGAIPHGRGWAITHAAWVAFVQAEADRRRTARNAPLAPREPTNDVEAMLVAAGLRRTR